MKPCAKLFRRRIDLSVSRYGSAQSYSRDLACWNRLAEVADGFMYYFDELRLRVLLMGSIAGLSYCLLSHKRFLSVGRPACCIVVGVAVAGAARRLQL